MKKIPHATKPNDPFVKAFNYTCGGTSHTDKFWGSKEVVGGGNLDPLWPECVEVLRFLFSDLATPRSLTRLKEAFPKSAWALKSMLGELLHRKLVVQGKKGYQINPARLGVKVVQSPKDPLQTKPVCSKDPNYKGRSKEAILTTYLKQINTLQKKDQLPPIALKDIHAYEDAMTHTPGGYRFIGLNQNGNPLYREYVPEPVGCKHGPNG